MAQSLDRARLLIQQARIPDAIPYIREHLSTQPDDPDALGLLSLCYLSEKKFAESLDLAKQAVQADPEDPWLYYVLGRAYFFNQQPAAARSATDRGLSLNPYFAQLFELRSEIAFYEENWQLALEEAERGLEVDPEEVDLINLRSRALIQLNRKAEAAATLDYALNKAPDNSMSHTNKGWVHIEQNQFDAAIDSFKEALRLQPGNNYARSGLKEAIKAKNPAYRIILKYFLWMNKLGSRGQWAVVIGLYVLFRILRAVASSSETMEKLLAPLFVVYIFFVYSTWIATPLSNLLLRLHPVGKLALDEDERTASNTVGLWLGLVALLFLMGLFSPVLKETILLAAVCSLAMLIPISGIFSVPAEHPSRRKLLLIAGGLGGCALLGILGVNILLIVFFLGILGYSFLVNYLVQKVNREF